MPSAYVDPEELFRLPSLANFHLVLLFICRTMKVVSGAVEMLGRKGMPTAFVRRSWAGKGGI